MHNSFFSHNRPAQPVERAPRHSTPLENDATRFQSIVGSVEGTLFTLVERAGRRRTAIYGVPRTCWCISSLLMSLLCVKIDNLHSFARPKLAGSSEYAPRLPLLGPLSICRRRNRPKLRSSSPRALDGRRGLWFPFKLDYLKELEYML